MPGTCGLCTASAKSADHESPVDMRTSVENARKAVSKIGMPRQSCAVVVVN